MHLSSSKPRLLIQFMILKLVTNSLGTMNANKYGIKNMEHPLL